MNRHGNRRGVGGGCLTVKTVFAAVLEQATSGTRVKREFWAHGRMEGVVPPMLHGYWVLSN